MKTTQRRFVSLLGIAALFVAACGGGTAEEQLPTSTDPDAAPPAAGACLIEEPECDDMGALPDGEANPLPPPSDDGVVLSDGMPADGELTVAETLVSDIGGVIAVQGFLFDDGSGPVLCDALAESYPPQCGAASIPISGHQEAIDVPVINEQGVTWSDQIVVLFGELIEGTLIVDPTVKG